ncbi:hypothetical protein FXO37_12358, partial [Capsicum annuum]
SWTSYTSWTSCTAAHVEHVAATRRGRKRGVEHITSSARGRGRDVKHVTASARGRERGIEHVAAFARGRERAAEGRGSGVEHVATAARGRERPTKTPLAEIGVARRTPLHEWFENPTIYAPPNSPASPIYALLNPPTSPVHSSQSPHASTGKRPKTAGMSVLIAENSFTTYNPEFPISRLLHTGSAHPIRSADITGGLGYKPKTGVKWRGKKAMTGNQLDVMRDEMRINKK